MRDPSFAKSPEGKRPTYADARPRIYIWAAPAGGAFWSTAPTGLRKLAEGAGAALEEALERVGRVPAVIIFDGQGGRNG